MEIKSTYKHITTTKACPICGAQIKLRGIGSHMRLVHPNASKSVQSAPKQLSMLSEGPEPPKKEVVARAPKRVQKAMEPSATDLILLSAAMYFLYRLLKTKAKPHTLSEVGKLTQRTGKIMLR